MTPVFTLPDHMTVVHPGNVRELVRGQENCLLEQVAPLVNRESVVLDLRQIERIDAAGIAVLIALYTQAHNAGHNFVVAHAPHRIENILALVGLDHILLAPEAFAACCERPAA
ncbi:MAG TPA: STAS domain-containing protein [Terracidiphilus sp.]